MTTHKFAKMPESRSTPSVNWVKSFEPIWCNEHEMSGISDTQTTIVRALTLTLKPSNTLANSSIANLADTEGSFEFHFSTAKNGSDQTSLYYLHI